MRSAFFFVSAWFALVAAPAVFAQTPPSSLPKEVLVLEPKAGQKVIFNAKDADKEGRFLVPMPGNSQVLVVVKEKRLDDWAKAYAVYAAAQKNEATAEAVRAGKIVAASLFETSLQGRTAVNVNLGLSVYGGVITGLPQGMTAAQYLQSGAGSQVIDLSAQLARQLRGGQ